MEFAAKVKKISQELKKIITFATIENRVLKQVILPKSKL
jgi:hypothetical protein